MVCVGVVVGSPDGAGREENVTGTLPKEPHAEFDGILGCKGHRCWPYSRSGLSDVLSVNGLGDNLVPSLLKVFEPFPS